MKVHLFGAVSSPGCANFALKRTADDFEEVFGKKPAESVRDDLYVDAGLKSLSSATQASSLIKSTNCLPVKGGFILYKFICNSKDVIEGIPKEQRASGIKELDLAKDVHPIERSSVVRPIRRTQVHVELKDRPLTRRGILVSSVYHPLVTPFLLTAKQILPLQEPN